MFSPLKSVQECMIALADIAYLSEDEPSPDNCKYISKYLKAKKLLPLFGEVEDKIGEKYLKLKFFHSACFHLLCGKSSEYPSTSNDKLISGLGGANELLNKLTEKINDKELYSKYN